MSATDTPRLLHVQLCEYAVETSSRVNFQARRNRRRQIDHVIRYFHHLQPSHSWYINFDSKCRRQTYRRLFHVPMCEYTAEVVSHVEIVSDR